MRVAWRCMVAPACVATSAFAATPVPALAQVKTGPPTITASGYVRAIAGIQDFGYDPLVSDRRSTFNGDVIRLKPQIEAWGRVRLNLHLRLQAQVTSASSQQGVLGFGVSPVPGRSIELSRTLVDEDHARIVADVDRLALTVFADAVDLTVGRQAITWGTANLFPVADLWAQFSPFELDTEEKPGVDAIRALLYPADNVELDVVIADRGVWRDVSAGVRATIELPVGDVYVGAGKFWREVIAMGGMSVVLDVWKLRVEAAAPWDVDAEESLPLRVTTGVDWIGGDTQLSLEYYHNGLGATRAADYGQLLASAALARGETQFLGRHYAGGFVGTMPMDRLTASLAALVNLTDRSAAALPAIVYDLGQSTRLSLGGLVTRGAKPIVGNGASPMLRSEYGTYGYFAYGQASVYF